MEIMKQRGTSMNLINIAHVPAPVVSPNDTVRDAVAVTLPDRCNAATVVDQERIIGILTSRDVMLKVVLRGLDPQSVLVGSVMTHPVVKLHPNTPAEEALGLMLANNFGHLPLTKDGAHVCGLLSMRNVMSYIVEDQQDNLHQMESFLNADGQGG